MHHLRTIFFFVCLIGLYGCIVPLQVRAAGLSESQISAVLSLLQTFGVDASVVSTVNATLHGQAVSAAVSSTSCPVLTRDLYVGVVDSRTGGEVSKLQQFLGGEVTGHFGPATLALVQSWQSAHGLVSSGAPSTTGYGSVGKKTRAAIASSCSAVVPVAVATSTPSATIYQQSLSSFPATQSISGTAAHIDQVQVSIAIPRIVGAMHCETRAPVIGGIWSVSGSANICTQALPFAPIYPLSRLLDIATNGYVVTVSSGDGAVLATGALSTTNTATTTNPAPTSMLTTPAPVPSVGGGGGGVSVTVNTTPTPSPATYPLAAATMNANSLIGFNLPLTGGHSIGGTATRTPQLTVSIANLSASGGFYCNETVPVVDGSWTVQSTDVVCSQPASAQPTYPFSRLVGEPFGYSVTVRATTNGPILTSGYLGTVYPSASIDQGSLTATSQTPTITGTANSLLGFNYSIGTAANPTLYGSGTVTPVYTTATSPISANGTWSVAVGSVLAPGSYVVTLTRTGSGTTVLATGTLIVPVAPAPTPTTPTTPATATISPNPLIGFDINSTGGHTIIGTATGASQVRVSIANSSVSGGFYCSETVPVTNGSWTVSGTDVICSQPASAQSTYPLSRLVGEPFGYLVTVQTIGGTALATGYLGTPHPSVSIDQSSLTATFQPPTITGTANVFLGFQYSIGTAANPTLYGSGTVTPVYTTATSPISANGTWSVAANASLPTGSYVVKFTSTGGGTTTVLATGTVTVPSTWVPCASETGVCSFTGKHQVRYGANGVYVIKTATNSIFCDTQTFGSDPAPYVVKSCDYSLGVVQGLSVYNFTQNLWIGERSADVSALQDTLRQLGYYSGASTGYFGSATAAAVKKLQSAQGLEQTGIVGPQTRALLNRGIEPVLQ